MRAGQGFTNYDTQLSMQCFHFGPGVGLRVAKPYRSLWCDRLQLGGRAAHSQTMKTRSLDCIRSSILRQRRSKASTDKKAWHSAAALRRAQPTGMHRKTAPHIPPTSALGGWPWLIRLALAQLSTHLCRAVYKKVLLSSFSPQRQN